MFEPRLLGFSCRLDPVVWKPNLACGAFVGSAPSVAAADRVEKKIESISSRDMACMQQQAVSQCRSDTAAVATQETDCLLAAVSVIP